MANNLGKSRVSQMAVILAITQYDTSECDL